MMISRLVQHLVRPNRQVGAESLALGAYERSEDVKPLPTLDEQILRNHGPKGVLRVRRVQTVVDRGVAPLGIEAKDVLRRKPVSEDHTVQVFFDVEWC